MNVSAQPDIVGQVPAVVVRVFIDDDVIAVPEPVPAVTKVKGRDAEVEAAKPEAIGAASAKVPSVMRAETTGEVAVLPGMVEVIGNTWAVYIVSNPGAVVVDVRSFGMARHMFDRLGGRAMRDWRTMFGNVPSTYGMAPSALASVLCKCR